MTREVSPLRIAKAVYVQQETESRAPERQSKREVPAVDQLENRTADGRQGKARKFTRGDPELQLKDNARRKRETGTHSITAVGRLLFFSISRTAEPRIDCDGKTRSWTDPVGIRRIARTVLHSMNLSRQLV